LLLEISIVEKEVDAIKTSIGGLTGYRGRVGQFSFILHRLAGLGTLFFLAIHILDTSTVYFFPSLYNHAIAIYRSTPFMILEIFLVFCVIYHGVNGARIALFDLFSPQRWQIGLQARSAIFTLAVAIVLWLPAAFLMTRSLLVNNFGW
jgi:succinate dehydrogenase / fumarate reductase, cytochrome b subunit